MLRYLYFIVLLIIIFLVGCSSQQQNFPTPQQQSSSKTEVNQEAPLPPREISPVSPLPIHLATPTLSSLPGTSAIRGKFIINASGQPLKGTAFYLVPGVGDEKADVPPAFAGKQDDTIQGFTDNEGEFVLSNIEPGSYYIFVWAPLRWVLVSTSDDEIGNQHPLNIRLQQNQIIELGDISIDWP